MKLQKTKKHLTNEKKNGIIKRSARHCKRHFADEYTEKYSRGRRGAPAKGVGRATGARVQISPSPPRKTRLNSQGSDEFSFFFQMIGVCVCQAPAIVPFSQNNRFMTS